jgi:hypothetical protein
MKAPSVTAFCVISPLCRRDDGRVLAHWPADLWHRANDMRTKCNSTEFECRLRIAGVQRTEQSVRLIRKIF